MGLMIFCLFVLGACSSDNDDPESFDQRLVGKWSNELTGENEKSFEIFNDGSFSAELDPMGQGRGIVTGKLFPEGSNFIMNNMVATTGLPWGDVVGGFNGQVVQIVISADGESFTMNSPDNTMVNAVFGGTYQKQQ